VVAEASVALVPIMARTPNTANDNRITMLLGNGRSVAAIAASVGVSEPTVYNTVKRLGLTLPSVTSKQSTSASSAAPGARTRKSSSTSPTMIVAAGTPSSPAGKKPPASRRTAATSPGVALVPVAPDSTLLTVRVDKGVELLKSLSARIVRHERDLAAARQRYAETLAALALD